MLSWAPVLGQGPVQITARKSEIILPGIRNKSPLFIENIRKRNLGKVVFLVMVLVPGVGIQNLKIEGITIVVLIQQDQR